MSEYNDSFIKMPTDKVAQMAQKAILFMETKRDQQTDKFVKEALQAEVNYWWHRLWRKKASTYEEMVEFLQNQDYGSYWWIHNQYNDQLNVANRILRACGQAEEIYLSTKDLDNIL